MKISNPLRSLFVVRKFCRRSALTAALLGVVAGGKAFAADQTWNNGASNFAWNGSSLNWNGSAWTAGNNAYFGPVGAGAVSVTGVQTVGNMIFSADGYSFSGGTLQFNGAANTVNTGAHNVTINSAIAFLSGGGISKSGTGKLTINSDITYVGTGQTIGTEGNNSGIIEIAGGTINGTELRLRGYGANSAVNITGGTVTLSGTGLTRGLVTGLFGSINISGGSVTTDRVVVGFGSSGTMSVSGSAFVDVSGADSLQVGNGANTNTNATLNLDGGTLLVRRITTTATAASSITTINLNGTIIRASASNILDWISARGDTATNSTTSAINVLAGGAIFDSNGNNVRIFRNLIGSSGDGGITKMGAGTVYLTGVNTVQGNTTVNAGTLLVGNVSGSALGSGNVVVKSGATFGGRGIVTGSVRAEAGSTLVAGGVSGESFSTTAIGTLTTGSQVWEGAARMQLEFSTDGSTGVAGAQWDRYAINGGLDLSEISSDTPFVVSLFTMSNATTRGALAVWDENVDSIWSGFLTTTLGITAFSEDKFTFDTSGFANDLRGSFSFAVNGNNLDLVYTAVPEPSTFWLILAMGGMVLVVRRLFRGRCRSGVEV